MRITTALFQRVLDALDGSSLYLVIDAGTPTSAGATSEVYRLALSPVGREPSASVAQAYVNEAVDLPTIGGYVVVADASAMPGSGVVFGWEEVTTTKPVGDSLTVEVEITVEEAT